MALPFIIGKHFMRSMGSGLLQNSLKRQTPNINEPIKRFIELESCEEPVEEVLECPYPQDPYQNFCMNVRERYRAFNAIEAPHQENCSDPNCAIDPCGPLMEPVRMDWVYPPKKNHTQPWDQNWDECCPPPPPPVCLCDPVPEPCRRPICTDEQTCLSTACKCPPPTCGDCCMPEHPAGCPKKKPPCPSCTKYKC